MPNYVRFYGADPDKADGKDEGGYFTLKEQPEIPKNLRRRMERCAGCYNDFYNNRANCGNINTCFSLDNYDNFRKRGQPKCFRR